jgi:methionine biosynthesis protein MetW
VSTPYGQLVASHGLSDSHRAILAAIPRDAHVLDVGCSTGYLAAALGATGCTVVGVEPDPHAAAAAREHADTVLEGDIETDELWPELNEHAPFDAVVCGDVLEHLRDPWTVLDRLASLLRPGGVAVVSVPNIAHWTSRRSILAGRFDYADWGLMDRTHLRFLTRRTAHDLVRGAGLELVDERPTPAPLPLQSRIPALGRLVPAAVERRPELFALQFVLVGRRPAAG